MVALCVKTPVLQDNVHAEVAPRELAGVAFAARWDHLAVDVNAAFYRVRRFPMFRELNPGGAGRPASRQMSGR